MSVESEQFSLPLGRRRLRTGPPAHFYNTIQLEGEALEQAIDRAELQEVRVYLIVLRDGEHGISSEEIQTRMPPATRITSVGRALCNLTDLGVLEKMPIEARPHVSTYGMPVHSWRLSERARALRAQT